MTRIIVSSGFAVSMILVALGVSQGSVDADTGQVMLVILPALAIASLGSKGRCSPFKGSRA